MGSGTDRELTEMFGKVDTDNSGKVDRHEFCTAIREGRGGELSLTVLMSKMDGQLEGLEEIFEDYKRKLESARKQAAFDIQISEASFAKFKERQQKIRLMKAENEKKIARLCG